MKAALDKLHRESMSRLLAFRKDLEDAQRDGRSTAARIAERSAVFQSGYLTALSDVEKLLKKEVKE